MALTQNAFARLAEIAKATQAGGMCYSLNDGALSELTSQNLVVVNPQLVQLDNATGAVLSIAARATDEGVKVYLGGPNAACTDVTYVQPAADAWGSAPVANVASEAAGRPEKPVFEVESYDALPEIVRQRGMGGIRPREAVFPWAETLPGQRFFIPAELSTKNKGEYVRHYSAANSANQRIRENYEAIVTHNQQFPNDAKPLPVAKHFKVYIVKAGEVLGNTTAPCDGEYVYCVAGCVAAPKQRESKPAQ